MGEGPLRLGLIGAGQWGRIYIKTLNRLEGFELVRLASSNPDSAELVGELCLVTDDWRDVASADDVDGVIIATPPETHAEFTRAAIAAGNPVLVEKPLTLDLAEARDLLDDAEQHGAIVHVDHIHLYHPAYRALKHQGLALGPIHAMRGGAGNWGPFRTDSSLLWDYGPHDIALCLDLMGEMPETVSQRLQETRITDDGPGQSIALQLYFANGVRADIDLSNLISRKKRYFAVHYDHDTLIYDDVTDHPLVREPRPDGAKCEPEKSHDIPVDNILPLDQVLFDFATAIRKGESDLDGLRLGLRVVEVLSLLDQQQSQ